MRVLHLNAGNLYGGVETFLTTLARLRGLCPGMEPHFGCCYEGRFTEELAAAEVPVHFLGGPGGVRMSRPSTVRFARQRLRELLEREHFDLVLCHMGWSLVIFSRVAQSAGVKVAVWEHGFQDKKTWLGWLTSRMRPDICIANSNFTAATARTHFPHTPVQVIYYPVALTQATQAERWRSDLRREEKVDDDTTVILQVSRMEPWKGHLLHLNALSRLKTQARWVCWIVGGPQKRDENEYFGQLQQTASRLGISDRVRFMGQRADVPKFLAAADIFCQPNQGAEPFGIVFIEALWAGKPVVTTAIGGAVEIIDESCGILTKPGDADNLAEALDRLLDSTELRVKLGESGPARALQLCDPALRMDEIRKLSELKIESHGSGLSRKIEDPPDLLLKNSTGDNLRSSPRNSLRKAVRHQENEVERAADHGCVAPNALRSEGGGLGA